MMQTFHQAFVKKTQDRRGFIFQGLTPGKLASIPGIFLRNSDGNSYAIFAVAVFVLFGLGGMALDTARHAFVQERMLAALDSAGLAAAKYHDNATLRDQQINQFFNVNMKNGYFSADLVESADMPDFVSVQQDGDIIDLSSAAYVPNVMMAALGNKENYVTAASQIDAKTRGLELTLLFDVSTSMRSRLPEVRTAAHSLMDKLYRSRTQISNMKVNVVSFANSVNIGRDRKHWLQGGEQAIFNARYEFADTEFVDEAFLQDQKERGHISGDLPLEFIDDPAANCTYRGDVNDYWHGYYAENIYGMVPAQWDGKACVLGIRQGLGYYSETTCKAPGDNGFPMGVWDADNGTCIVGDYWKGCVLARMPSMSMTKDELETFANNEGYWPVGITRPDASGRVAFQDHAMLGRVLSQDPPDALVPESQFLPYVWEPKGGVGHKNYDPHLPSDTYGDIQNNPDFPLGLGMVSKGDYSASENKYAMEDDEDNWNDYLGGAGVVDSSGNSLIQPIDERLYISGHLDKDASFFDTIIDNDDATPRGPNLGCPPPIRTALSNRSDINAAIDGLYSPGNSMTVTSIGLVWAWRTLSEEWKNLWSATQSDFPKDYDTPNHDKVIVFLTDGVAKMANQRWSAFKRTWSFATLGTYNTHEGRKYLSHSIFFQSMELCERIKQSGIELYVVTRRLGTDDVDASGVIRDLPPFTEPEFKDFMQGCATDADHFYYLDNFDLLDKTYQQIANKIASVRITQ